MNFDDKKMIIPNCTSHAHAPSEVILKTPDPVMVGKPVTLQCDAGSPDAFTGNPSVNWYHANNDSLITSGIESGGNL